MSRTQKLLSAAAGVLLLAVLAFRLTAPPKVVVGEFVPPPFEENACSGAPQGLEDRGYGPLELDDGFRVALCGAPTADGEGLALYLTSDPGNTVWVKARVLDGEGHILGESGLLRPGEYLSTIPLAQSLPQTGEVVVKLMSYEPETYYSKGAANIRLTAQMN